MSSVGPDTSGKDTPKGFSGLSSLVSSVNELPKPPQAAAKAQPQAKAQTSNAGSEPPAVFQAPAKNSSGGRWAVGIAIFFVLVWVIARVDSDKPSTASAGASTSTTTLPARTVPVDDLEIAPPVGQGLVLTVPQLRYCVSEAARLDGAEAIVDSTVDADVDRLNAMIGDYNSRCSNFRYSRGNLERVRREVEARKAALRAAGMARFVQH